MSVGFLIAACISIAAIYFTGIADRAFGYSESGIMRDAAVQSLMSSLGIFAVGALLSAAIGWLVWRIIQRILLGDSKAKPYFFSCLAALLAPAILTATYSFYEVSMPIIIALIITLAVVFVGAYFISLLIFVNTTVSPRNRNIVFMAVAAVMAQLFLMQGFGIYVGHLAAVEREFKARATAQYENERSAEAQREDVQARELFDQQIAYMEKKGIPQLQPNYIEPGYRLLRTEIASNGNPDNYRLVYEEVGGTEKYFVEIFAASAYGFKELQECMQLECKKMGALADGSPIYRHRVRDEEGRLFTFKNNVVITVSDVILTITPNGLEGSLQTTINADAPTHKVLSSLTESPLVNTDIN